MRIYFWFLSNYCNINVYKLISNIIYKTYNFCKSIFESIPLNLSSCLLYTSDAADERSSVDLGGRRIIKKKNNITKDSSTTI